MKGIKDFTGKFPIDEFPIDENPSKMSHLVVEFPLLKCSGLDGESLELVASGSQKVVVCRNLMCFSDSIRYTSILSNGA